MTKRQTLRVLLVEDDDNDAELMKRQIEHSNGFVLHTKRVETEVQVRRALNDESWDAVICDFNLPKLDALKVLDIMENLGLDLPFILVSGKISQEAADDIFDRGGVHEYVDKKNIGRLGAVFHREMATRAAYDQLLRAWADALEIRDHETAGHSERVTSLTLALARELNTSETELLHMRRGALLHDIGKMGIPDSVLLKPGKLTDAEYSTMQRHPKIAYDMLTPLRHLRKSLDIPYCHHERWDGMGYPRQLQAYEIPVSARIFSVCDVYDAFTSDRPYHDKLPQSAALDYITDQSGKHFDPIVVEAFLRMIKFYNIEGDFHDAQQ